MLTVHDRRLRLTLRRLYRSHDESLRRRTDEVERIAGNESQRLHGRRIQYRHVFGLDDPDPLDAIDLAAFDGLELHDIAGANILQPAEKSIAVASDAGIAHRSRQSRFLDVAQPAVEHELVRPRQYRHLETDLGDAQNRERRRSGLCERGLPGPDTAEPPRADVGHGRLGEDRRAGPRPEAPRNAASPGVPLRGRPDGPLPKLRGPSVRTPTPRIQPVTRGSWPASSATTSHITRGLVSEQLVYRAISADSNAGGRVR